MSISLHKDDARQHWCFLSVLGSVQLCKDLTEKTRHGKEIQGKAWGRGGGLSTSFVVYLYWKVPCCAYNLWSMLTFRTCECVLIWRELLSVTHTHHSSVKLSLTAAHSRSRLTVSQKAELQLGVEALHSVSSSAAVSTLPGTASLHSNTDLFCHIV